MDEHLRKTDYVELLTQQCVSRFMRKLAVSDIRLQNLVIVSPFIGTLEGTRFDTAWLLGKIHEQRVPTFIVTREPRDDYHRLGVELLSECQYTEIRFHSAVHGKVYVALSRDISKSFAMFGSANLTTAGAERNIEVGMMVYGRGKGREIIRELHRWGTIHLRTDAESKVWKRIGSVRRKAQWSSETGSV